MIAFESVEKRVTFRSQVRAACPRGFLVGPQDLFCDQNGTWKSDSVSASPPRCQLSHRPGIPLSHIRLSHSLGDEFKPPIWASSKFVSRRRICERDIQKAANYSILRHAAPFVVVALDLRRIFWNFDCGHIVS